MASATATYGPRATERGILHSVVREHLETFLALAAAPDEHHDDASRSESVVTRFNISPVMAVSAICVLYVFLGTAMERRS